ncbi:YCF48-related protein [Bythopirellula polymerisocia]|uniref:Ycf48-like protein n=1 Tax=Bythopirellula polymerisocia TaxID=2528003 RepID=A0A5C6D3C6_9BACT|nr:YCF48-related protein [Bythopirellula polymerisocia]TWU30157.1 Ycf48-like protein precursor [Bythopirellula polymerisocia]
MIRAILLLLCTWLSLTCASDLAAQEALPPEITPGAMDAVSAPLVEDASLFDTHFVDAQYGWAVGAHGCIWHTTDGGAHWHQQSSHVDVRLSGVWFLDRQLGWAVGGATQPYLWTTQGIVLRTTDGGKTWKKLLAFVPALERVKFFDPQHGVAWGHGSGGEPLGLFASDDGGRNWRPLGVGVPSVWWGGDFVDQRQGIIVGPGGQMARLVAGDAVPITLDQQTTRNAHAVRLSADGIGWMVGEAGMIEHTTDRGANWEAISILPEEIANHIQWRSVATMGENVWIAGSPGSVVLHSPDAGDSWQGYATGSCTPLNQLTFADESHGWAVGDFGAILHTSDGGQTWQTQRGEAERSAVLMILENERELPLAALAKLAKCDGYRTIVHLLTPPRDDFRFDQLSATARIDEAITFLGGNAVTHAWQFPSNEHEDLDTRLAAEIVRLLRTWQPLVLIVPDAHEASTGLGKRIAAAAEIAVTQAADENHFLSLSEQLALTPWQVSRIYALLPPDMRGTHRVQSEETIAGTSLADSSIAARSLLSREFSPPEIADEFRLLASLAGEPTAQIDDLVAGLGATPGSASRRALSSQDISLAAQSQQRLIEKRRNLRNIFRASGGNPALLGQVGQMLTDMDPTAAAALLYELATHFQKAGQLDLKAATLELMARRYPSDPLVDAALVWLVQYYASGEAAHAYHQITPAVAQAIAVEVPSEVSPQTDSSVEPATATSYEKSLDFQRFTRAVQITQHIAQTRPLLHSEPQVRVPWAIAERKRSIPAVAEKYLESLSLRAPGEAWQLCGSIERWLTEPGRPKPPVPLADCRFSAEKPHLDGTFDEPMWQQEFVKFETPSSEFLFTRDEEYFYFAVRCEKDPALSYSTDDRPRTYDTDLTSHDRVSILLDMDRDYTTYFDLTIDHRGWTNDACWQDHSWNPQWFVAAGGDEKTWTIEVAIPWSELTATPPEIGDTWAIGIERFVPGKKTQSLARPLVGEPDPTNYGLLRFK